MCRCISELWLRAFLKLNSKAAPSLSAPALSIYHNYSELNNSLTSFFHFSLFYNFSLKTLYQPVFLCLTLSSTYLPFLFLWHSGSSLPSSLHHTKKNTPMAFTPSVHAHKHICHISLFHHSSPDPGFAICTLCGFVWISTILWKSHTPSLDASTAGRGRGQLCPVRS